MGHPPPIQCMIGSLSAHQRQNVESPVSCPSFLNYSLPQNPFHHSLLPPSYTLLTLPLLHLQHQIHGQPFLFLPELFVVCFINKYCKSINLSETS